jgi:hypothetical protein
VDTVIFHIDALTGEDASGVARSVNDRALQGKDIISGPMVEAYLLDHDDVRVVLLLDEFLQVRSSLPHYIKLTRVGFRSISIHPRHPRYPSSHTSHPPSTSPFARLNRS